PRRSGSVASEAADAGIEQSADFELRFAGEQPVVNVAGRRAAVPVSSKVPQFTGRTNYIPGVGECRRLVQNAQHRVRVPLALKALEVTDPDRLPAALKFSANFSQGRQ